MKSWRPRPELCTWTARRSKVPWWDCASAQVSAGDAPLRARRNERELKSSSPIFASKAGRLTAGLTGPQVLLRQLPDAPLGKLTSTVRAWNQRPQKQSWWMCWLKSIHAPAERSASLVCTAVCTPGMDMPLLGSTSTNAGNAYQWSLHPKRDPKSKTMLFWTKILEPK